MSSDASALGNADAGEEVVSAIRRRMKEILKGKGLEDVVSFEVGVVEGIENDPKTGKFKLIIPFKRG